MCGSVTAYVPQLFEAVVRGVWRNNSLPMIRHVILGPSGAGKTSLFRRMYGREFETEVPPTIGVDFAMLTMDSGGCPAKFQTWDTAGFTSGRIGASKLTWRNSYLRGSHVRRRIRVRHSRWREP
jgi:GTPase SAR1 family protein